ncbi:MAG: hypothetical protein DMF89_13240 [Acidobacteria bacterium]|nr:MAG: hypothetical protein DMF89_13240 [Acidobacteriota bacterium]
MNDRAFAYGFGRGRLMKSTRDQATRLLESWRLANADLRCAFDDIDWSFSCSGRITSTVPRLKLRGAGFEAMLSLAGAEIEYECYDLDSETHRESAPEQTVSLTLTLPKSGRVHIVGRQTAERTAPRRPLPFESKN